MKILVDKMPETPDDCLWRIETHRGMSAMPSAVAIGACRAAWSILAASVRI